MWQIGHVVIPNRVVAAPLAGISTAAFRRIAHGMGAGLIYTEMVSDKALEHQNKKTLSMLKVGADEGHVALQLFGAERRSLQTAVQLVNTHSDAVIIDFNLGCPVPKVVKGNGGASLMRDVALAADLVASMVEVAKKPVTVKIRSGWNEQDKNAVVLAEALERAGAAAIAVHPRTRAQMYRGHADWSVIKAVKQAVGIPVIGNGDVKRPEDARRMLEETGCDAVMIGRALLGNPWLLKMTRDFLDQGTYEPEVSLTERLAMIQTHAQGLIEEKGEHVAMLEMRGHAAWYMKGLKDSAVYKRQMSQIKTYDELMNLIAAYAAHIQTR